MIEFYRDPGVNSTLMLVDQRKGVRRFQNKGFF